MIAAVVVTYNRKKELQINMKALLEQEQNIDSIIIIDNHSTDGTKESIKKVFANSWDKIDYYYLPENIGGAGGFETGTKIAFEQGYDYIWLMDDDGHPQDSKTLYWLMEFIHRKTLENHAFLINSLVLSDGDKLSFGLYGWDDYLSDIFNKAVDGEIKNLVNPFNGTLISRKLVERIGFPNGAFFIKGDEVDYLNRAIESEAYVATVINSLYYHPELPKQFVTILGRKVLRPKEAPWKRYYSMRNHTYMYIQQRRIAYCLKHYVVGLAEVLLLKRGKLKLLKMLTRGLIDGMKGKLGATVKP